MYLFDATYNFNLTKGSLAANNITTEAIRNQLKLIKSELQELEDAIEQRSEIETIDGVMDVLVTTFGMYQMLEAAGAKMQLAETLVGNNNMTKFPRFLVDAEHSLNWYKENYPENEFRIVKSVDSTGANRYMILDENDKVRKPVGYTSVNLQECVGVFQYD